MKLEWYVHGCVGEIELIEGVNFIIDTVTNTIIITANIPGTLPAPCNNYNFVLTQGTSIMLDPPYNEREAQWGWGGYRQHNKSNSYGTNQPRALTLLMNGQPATVQITQMNTKMTYSNPEFLPKLAEWHIYGNEQQGRFLTKYPEQEPTYYGVDVTEDIRNGIFSRQLGKKAYELKDHLGNVRVTHSDIKMPTGSGTQPFRVDLLSKSEYYPGGMPILDLSYQLENKRYGYNSGAEVDREIFSQKDRAFSTLFREGDTYTLRWWSQDPKRNELPHQSTYSYMDANPILKNDPDGDVIQMATGAVIGGGVEYTSQVIGNLMDGQGLKQALTNVDGDKILVATTFGALTGGGSAITGVLTNKLRTKIILNAVVAGSGNTAEQAMNAKYIDKKEYSWSDARRDFVLGGSFSMLGDGLLEFANPYIKKYASKAKELKDDLDDKTKILDNKIKDNKRVRQGHKDKVKDAKEKLDNYGKGIKADAVNQTLQASGKKIIENLFRTKPTNDK